MGGVARSRMVPKEERKGNSHTIPEPLRREVIARDNGKCQVCGSDKEIRVSHRTPICQGGMSLVWNLVVLCKECWNAKGNLNMEEMIHTLHVRNLLIGDPFAEHPVRVTIVFDDKTMLDGIVPDDPDRLEGNFYVKVGSFGGKIFIERAKVKSIVVWPTFGAGTGPQEIVPVEIEKYLKKISS